MKYISHISLVLQSKWKEYEIVSCSSAVPSDPSATQTGKPLASSLTKKYELIVFRKDNAKYIYIGNKNIAF